MIKVFRLVSILIVASICAIGFAQNKVVIGKLGQALSATTIYSRPSSRAHVYYRSKPYEYLVVRSSGHQGWLGVVLMNGAIGFVKQANVATLPYVVKADAAPRRQYYALNARGTTTSRANMAAMSTSYIGTPYKWGGNDILNGIDCSGFVKKMYGSIGLNLPRTAAEQSLVGQPVTRFRDLQPGDRLYFWDAKRHKIGHTGIYIGSDYFVHASSGHHGVATDNLASKSWLKILVAARR